MTVFHACPSGAFAAGAAVDDKTLQLTFTYVEFEGQRYNVVMDFAGDLGDGLYWKFNSMYPTTVTGQCGGSVDANLNVRDICVLLSGREYKVNMDFVPHPSGHEGLFWRLDEIQVLDCTISRVTGGDEECFDPSYLQCISGCGEDLECMMRCIGESAFSLAIEYENNTSSDQVCELPAGTIFKPYDIGLQNMLLIGTKVFVIPSRSTKKFCIPTYCLNSDLGAPGEVDLYGSGGGATSECMIEIINSVQGKVIDDGPAIQDIVWDCADSGTISEEQRSYLRSLKTAN